MALTLYYLSGSPYAWRVWLGLEHKHMPYELINMSYDAGDFKKPEFLALNPRHRVPVIVDDGFVLMNPLRSSSISRTSSRGNPACSPSTSGIGQYNGV